MRGLFVPRPLVNLLRLVVDLREVCVFKTANGWSEGILTEVQHFSCVFSLTSDCFRHLFSSVLVPAGTVKQPSAVLNHNSD